MTQRHAFPVLPILAMASAACSAEATLSSRSYLGASESGAVSSRDVVTTAREVSRLFEIRGYQLLDQHIDSPGGELVLKFAKSQRALAPRKDDDQPVGAGDVGSVFYAWIAPHGRDEATVALLGKPTLAGTEPCTDDGVPLRCGRVTGQASFVSTLLSGRDEAEVAHGVLTELALEGVSVGPLPPSPGERAEQSARCVARAKDAIARAQLMNDLDKRAEVLKDVPRCDGTGAVPSYF
jgi:hypothetical protein